MLGPWCSCLLADPALLHTPSLWLQCAWTRLAHTSELLSGSPAVPEGAKIHSDMYEEGVGLMWRQQAEKSCFCPSEAQVCLFLLNTRCPTPENFFSFSWATFLSVITARCVCISLVLCILLHAGRNLDETTFWRCWQHVKSLFFHTWFRVLIMLRSVKLTNQIWSRPLL